jgi:hypothetical protein
MIPVLARRFPRARIIALHAEDPGRDTGEGKSPEAGGARWYPGLALGAEDFLEQELENAAAGEDFPGAESVKIIEWRPARDRYGERYLRLLAAAAAALRRFDAGRRTLRAFGRRWFRNFFRNLRLLRSFPVYREPPVPIVVTGAGPSLEESIPLIGKLQEGGGCFIIASSSSVMALLYRGIIPDLALSTDGGPWALLHLYGLFRGTSGSGPGNPAYRGTGKSPALAAAFSASLPSQCGELPVLWIGDGSLWQGLILRGLGIPHLVLPQRGTVTAAALDLAFALGRGRVYIAGMDLETRDIRSHTRPYGFDRLWREGASRFSTEYGRHFSRSLAMREGGSHRVYAEWFAARLGSYNGRVYSLGRNNPLFGNLPQAEDSGVPETGGGKRSNEGPVRLIPIRVEDPVSKALGILRAALEDQTNAPSLVRELEPLLLPGIRNPGPGELWGEAESLARRGAPGGGTGD